MNKIKRSSRKITVFFLSLLMLLSLAPITVFAENTSGVKDSGKCGADGDNVTWTLYNDGELVISGEGDMTDYNYADNYVPWNKYLNDILTVKIIKGVTTVGDTAFNGCLSLTSVELPDGLISIGYSAFKYCESLTNIKFPDSLQTIGYSSFSNCKSLIGIKIPDNVTEIDAFAFFCCKSITSVEIPDGVTTIGEEAFYSCSSLEKIVIPKSVINISSYEVFTGCSSLVDIYYTGSEEEWNAIRSDTPLIFDAEIHFNYIPVEPATELKPNADSDITVLDGNIAKAVPGMSVDTIKNQLSNENVKVLDKNGNELEADKLTGTGSKIQVLDNDGKVLSEYEVLVPMDVDGNAQISAADARLALRKSAKLEKLEGVFERACNADGNDRINAADARKILRVSAKLEAYSV